MACNEEAEAFRIYGLGNADTWSMVGNGEAFCRMACNKEAWQHDGTDFNEVLLISEGDEHFLEPIQHLAHDLRQPQSA